MVHNQALALWIGRSAPFFIVHTRARRTIGTIISGPAVLATIRPMIAMERKVDILDPEAGPATHPTSTICSHVRRYHLRPNSLVLRPCCFRPGFTRDWSVSVPASHGRFSTLAGLRRAIFEFRYPCGYYGNSSIDFLNAK